jgi:hypothetical protein
MTKKRQNRSGFRILATLWGFFFLLASGSGTAVAKRRDRPLRRSESFFGLHFDLHPNQTDTELGAGLDGENIERLLTRVKPDYVQYDCKGHPGYAGYPTRVGWSSPGIIRDGLALWRKKTREHGIALFIHYSGVWDSKAIEEHPEWARVDAAGKRDPNATSVFSPYVDRLLIPQLKEVSSVYGIDGVWVDGDSWAVQLDYSPAALSAWLAETGFRDAPKEKSDPRWLAWKMFQRRAFEKYLCHWVDELHAFNPKLQLTSNWMYSSIAPKPIVARVDFLSGDYSPSLSVDRVRFDARYLASTGMPWDLMAWGFDHGKNQGWSLKTPPHLQQEAAVALMQGGGFQVYHTPTRSGYIPEAIISQLGAIADFCRARQKISHKSVSIPQVALLLSSETLWDGMDNLFLPTEDDVADLQGALQALLELHYSVDILAEHQLQPRLKEFPLVVIPDALKIAAAFKSKLVEYVENGGNLLLLGEKCARLFQSELAEEGIRFESDPKEKIFELATAEGPVNVNGIWQTISAPTGKIVARVHPTRDTRKNGEAAAVLVFRGKGRIAAVFGPVARIFYNGHHPYLRGFIGDLTQKLFPDPAVRVVGPSCLDLSLRRTREGRISVHLLNRSHFPVPDRYNFIDFIPPVGPVTIFLSGIRQKPDRVILEPSGRQLKFGWKTGRLQVDISEIRIHDILVVE